VHAWWPWMCAGKKHACVYPCLYRCVCGMHLCLALCLCVYAMIGPSIVIVLTVPLYLVASHQPISISW